MRMFFIAGICCAAIIACSDGSVRGEACSNGSPPSGALLNGVWDSGFVLPGVNGDAPGVLTTALDANGGLYVGGTFSFAGSAIARNVVRWTPDEGWMALGAGVDGIVTASAVAPDGALWVATSNQADDFSSYWHTIRRWDGVWHEVSIVTLPPNLREPQRSGIQRMVFDEAGTLIVAGDFSAIDGLPISRLAAFGPAGWDDLNADPDGPVYALAADSSGLCVGGAFGEIGGIPATRVACRTSSGWTALDLNDLSGTGVVRALTRDADGKLYAGGIFRLSPISTNDGGSIASWEDGAWTLIDRGVGIWDVVSQTNLPGLVRDFAWIGSELVVGGSFENAGGTSDSGRAVVDVLHLARIRPGISSWEDAGRAPISVGITLGSDNVFSLATDGSSLYAGGLFSSVGSVSAFNVAKRSGETWGALTSPTDDVLGIEGTVGAMVAGDCEVFIGGTFQRAGKLQASNVAVFRPESGYEALGTGIEGTVTALAVHPDSGHLYAAETVCVQTPELIDCTQSRVMRWDGDSWTTFADISAVSIFALGFDANGTLYGAGGGEIGNVLRWNGKWEPVGGDVGGPALALIVESDGSLTAGGIFETAGGSPARNVARWDGSKWGALAAGLENPVLTLTKHGDGIVAGTQKSFRSSSTSPLVAEWNGSTWIDVGAPLEQDAFSPQIQELVSGGDYLVAVGQFPFIGGAAILSDGVWTVVAGMNQFGRAAALRPEGVYIGGGFSIVEDGPSVGLGLLRPRT